VSSDGLGPIIEALLFLSPEPVSAAELAEAIEAGEEEVAVAVDRLESQLDADGRGLRLRRVAGGYALAAMPAAEDAARRLLARPRTPPLTQAQAEVLAIVAYLQPVSRPEVARIRGVSSDSAVGSLTERGMIEERGRTQFGAVTYGTTALFEKLFGLSGLDALPDPAQFDPTPEDERELRDRLLKAGEQRVE
jgi:segregation and condensation protein B